MPTLYIPRAPAMTRYQNPCVPTHENPCGCEPCGPPPVQGLGIPATFDVKSMAIGLIVGALVVYLLMKSR